MTEHDWLATQFETHRTHLNAVAYRMLGSGKDVDDAVQEAWLRLSRSDVSGVENLRGWLTTVVSRVCLDMLRARTARREEALDDAPIASSAETQDSPNPERDAVLADSVGLALLVVLDTLAPAERLAFVLHDMFSVPFDDIAAIVGRSPEAVRQMASRARRRVRGTESPAVSNRTRQRQIVDAFLTALRNGDMEALLAVLDPDLVASVDVQRQPGMPREVRGARTWAQGAVAFGAMARSAQPALVNGQPALVVAPGGRLLRAVIFTFSGDRITRLDVITDAATVAAADVQLLED
jgi:RNA polymerase sigma factor (sigma-70 family)